MRLQPETGILYQLARRPQDPGTQWVYEPKNARDKSEFFYYIYRDSATPFIEAVLPRQIMDITLDQGTARLMANAYNDRTLGGFGPMGNCFVMRSPFYLLRRHFVQLHEIEENLLDADGQLAHPIAVFTKKPMKEILPSLTSHEALEMASSTRLAAQMESQEIARRGFLAGVEFMKKSVLPAAPYVNPFTGDSDSKADIMRALHGRSHPHDDALITPEDIASVARTPPAPKLELQDWIAAHVREVAIVFQLPISFVEASFIGQSGRSAATSGSRASRSSEGENRGMDLKAEKAFKAERQNMSRFFAWVYPKSLGGFELLGLTQWLERVTEDEYTSLGQLLRGRQPSRSERRAVIGDMLPPPPRRRRGRKGARQEEDSETEEGGATGISARELRRLIAERLQAERYLPAEIHFEVDDTSPEELLDDYDMLPDEVKASRLERAKVIVAYAEAGGASDDSTRRELGRLMGVSLKAATADEIERKIPLKPPPVPPGKK